MLCVSWNVNGIRAVLGKGIKPWEAVPGADVVCLQETKAQPQQVDPDVVTPPGWHGHWASAEKKGYSGVAIYSREKPDEILDQMGEDFDREGRLIAARFGEIVVASAYFPNSQDKGKRLDYKLAYCSAMEVFLQSQRDLGREVLLMGDYNIAHQPLDLARPKQNEANPGYLPEERAWMSRYLDLGYRDVFREKYPERKGAYSWWSFRTAARERNIGWRIDYGTTTPALGDRVADAAIHQDVVGSDHCPVSVLLK